MDINRIILATSCGLATWALLGRSGLAPGLLAAALAWTYQTAATALAIAAFVLLVVIHGLHRTPWRWQRPAPHSPGSTDQGEIIDAEFTIADINSRDTQPPLD